MQTEDVGYLPKAPISDLPLQDASRGEVPAEGPHRGKGGGGILELEVPMPSKVCTPKMMHRASELRQNKMEAEAKLWSRLRAHRMAGVQFRRQHAIGSYIVDFGSLRRKLVIELDGSQHLDQAAYDSDRTKYLEAKGYRVLRFWNNDVMNEIDVVLNAIWTEINK